MWPGICAETLMLALIIAWQSLTIIKGERERSLDSLAKLLVPLRRNNEPPPRPYTFEMNYTSVDIDITGTKHFTL
jgi:hypothetical protein